LYGRVRRRGAGVIAGSSFATRRRASCAARVADTQVRDHWCRPDAPLTVQNETTPVPILTATAGDTARAAAHDGIGDLSGLDAQHTRVVDTQTED
jgi:hypothetical protein